MAEYTEDPGGRFDSDTHRRVLGHLSLPEDDYGWSVEALVNRMVPDVGTSIVDADEMGEVLGDLEASGYAENQDGIWRMTQEGLDTLTDNTSDEPPAGAEASPAMVGTNGAGGGSTPMPAAKKGGKK